MSGKKGYYYVDKPPLIEQLVDEGECYFLSRPRRFGKSLLISTLKEFFECNEALFQGLSIFDRWDWETPHLMVRLSFGGKYSEPDELEKDILRQLTSVERRQKLAPDHASDTGPIRFGSILDRLNHTTNQQIVVLVDEYDKPILDVLENAKQARANRDYLQGFYGIIKDYADYIRFVFITGISMYSRTNLFSGMNNLDEISPDPQSATVCGYTGADLAAEQYKQQPQKQRLFGAFQDAAGSWYGQRRVIVKAEQMPLGAHPRDIVTHLTGDPQCLYEQVYCARGDMENLIKQPQRDLFADRTRCTVWWSNQLRLLWSTFADRLLDTIRAVALEGTRLARAYVGTIRLKLLKIGAVVLPNTRRVRWLMPTSCSYQGWFRDAAEHLKLKPG